MSIWNFQSKAVTSVLNAFAQGKRRVLLVGPTGSGKTRMGSEVAGGFRGRALWVAHRDELVAQAARALRAVTRPGEVSIIGTAQVTNARVAVGTVQTFIKRELPSAQLIVLDEAHHYEAEEWRKMHDAYPDALILGLTATPERADGSRLGDIFDELIVSASYSDLVSSGVLVPWDVLHPAEFLGSDLAQDPLDAYFAFAGREKTIAFYRRVWQAVEEASRLRRRGIKAESIYGQLLHSTRRKKIDGFRGESFDVLNNVFCLTEGFDAPQASVVILARPFHNRANYVQACGRAGRSFLGKSRALLIDLCGSSHLHGSPVSDWEYKLAGKGTPEPRELPEEPVERTGPTLGDVLGVELIAAPFSISQAVRVDSSELPDETGSGAVDVAIADVLKKKGLSAADRARALFRSL